jgi:hypothetical protein
MGLNLGAGACPKSSAPSPAKSTRFSGYVTPFYFVNILKTEKEHPINLVF